MNTENYKKLVRDEIVALADDLRIKMRESEFIGDFGFMIENLPRRSARIWSDKNQSEKAEELEAIIKEVGDEVFRRFDMGWYFRLPLPDKSLSLDMRIGHHVSLVVREDKLLIDCCVIYGQVHSFELQRKDGRKEIPDEQLLHERPHEWLAEHLHEYEEVSSSSFGVR